MRTQTESNTVTRRARDDRGFSLVELIVVMAVFVGVMALAGSAFNTLLTHSGKQSRLAEGQIMEVAGLETLRYDIEHAGYALPWSFQSAITYEEAEDATAAGYNDAPSGVPWPLRIGDDAGLNGTDYLVVKSAMAARNDASGKSSHMGTGSARPWQSDNPLSQLVNTDSVVVINPRFQADDPSAAGRELVVNGSEFFANYSAAIGNTKHLRHFSPDNYPMASKSPFFFIYGLDTASSVRMPFNRADFFVERPANIAMRCADDSKVGVLYKAVVRQDDGELIKMPLLDCVADFQVVFGLDTNGDGSVDLHQNDLESPSELTDVRRQLKEIEVFVLAHEGARDPGFSYPQQKVMVGYIIGTTPFGREFDLATINNWRNYRWKVYSFIVLPKNLGNY